MSMMQVSVKSCVELQHDEMIQRRKDDAEVKGITAEVGVHIDHLLRVLANDSDQYSHRLAIKLENSLVVLAKYRIE
jgi:hypothetical protein